MTPVPQDSGVLPDRSPKEQITKIHDWRLGLVSLVVGVPVGLYMVNRNTSLLWFAGIMLVLGGGWYGRWFMKEVSPLLFPKETPPSQRPEKSIKK